MENQQQISNTQNQQNAHQQEAESSISLKDIVFLVINNWYWFAIGPPSCHLDGLHHRPRLDVYRRYSFHCFGHRLMVWTRRTGGK